MTTIGGVTKPALSTHLHVRMRVCVYVKEYFYGLCVHIRFGDAIIPTSQRPQNRHVQVRRYGNIAALQ